MVDALLIFGSKTNKKLYKSLAGRLKKKKVSFELRIASAHKSPRLVESIVRKREVRVVVAGAGLSAALPGVIASKTIVPVIGLPAGDNFNGLDALLTVMQMPPGVPVLACGVDGVKTCAREINKILSKPEKITLIWSKNKAFERCRKMFAQLEVNYSIAKKIDPAEKKTLFIDFVDVNKTKVKDTKQLVIHVPIGKDSVDALKKLLKATKNGLWVGWSKGGNAAIAATQILGEFEKLKKYRKGIEKKIEKDDNKERVKFW